MRKLGVSILIIRTHFSNINNRHQDINLCKFLDTIMQHMNAKKKKKKLSMSKNVHFIVCFFIQRTSILQNCLEECRCTECIQPLSSKNLTGGGGGGGGGGGEMLWRVLSQKWPPTGWNTCAKFLAVHFLTKDSVQEFSSIWTESHDASFCFLIATTLRVQCTRWLWPSSPVPPCCHRVWCVTGLLLATHMFLLSARC